MKRVEIIEQAIGNFSCSHLASWRGVAEAVEAALTAAAQEQTAPEPPPETEADKLARLDPESMTKHPELWQVGDKVRLLCGGALGLVVHMAQDLFGNWFVTVQLPDATNAWLASAGEWRDRPPLPTGTVVTWSSRLWFVRPRPDGRYAVFQWSSTAYSDDCLSTFAPVHRSALRPLMLPPEGGWA